MKRTLQLWLERWPSLYLGALRVKRRRHWSRHWVLSRQTDLVVEGFPRSANSFAFHALKKMNPDLAFATHTHSPAQIVLAARWRVPTMVLLRDPLAAVTGLLAFGRQLTRQDENAVAPVSAAERIQVLARWEFFYQQVETVRADCFIARFDDVIADFAAVSRRFLERYKRPWLAYDPSVVPEKELLGASFHVGPDPRREVIKESVQASVEEARRAGAFDKALALYERLGKD